MSSSAREKVVITQDDEILNLTKLAATIDRERQIHRLAAIHFSHRHFYGLFMPVLLITLATAVVALFTTFPSNVTGILAAVSVFFQSIDKFLNYNSRSAMHGNAGIAMKNTYEELMILIYHVPADYGTQTSTASTNGAEPENINSSLLEYERKKISINDRFLQAREGIDQSVPMQITSAYAIIDMWIKLNDRVQEEFKIDDAKDVDAEGKVKGDRTTSAGHAVLFNVICNAWCFPLFIPSSDWSIPAAKTALYEMKRNDDDARPAAKRCIPCCPNLLQCFPSLCSLPKQRTCSTSAAFARPPVEEELKKNSSSQRTTMIYGEFERDGFV